MATGGVRDYYERNTRSFLRFGQGASTGTIHRAVWGPGVDTRSEAFEYPHQRIAGLLDALDVDGEAIRLLDLGCGVGATLEDVHRRCRRPIEGIGVTLSPTQVDLARRRWAAAGLGAQLRCIEGDFARLPRDLGSFDAAIAIESFVHGSDPRAFFAEAARVVRPGGRLVVCDDWLTERGRGVELDPIQHRWLREFRQGWAVQSLLTPDGADALARSAGWVSLADEDWTAWLELRRPRDRLIAAAVTLGRPLRVQHPWWNNLVGGNALQHALLGGLVAYRFRVWRRSDPQPSTPA